MKLSEHGAVTEEALIAYLQNELSPEEKQELEKLLLQDPFAADALEGLRSSASQSTVSSSLSSLNKKVRERSGLKERRTLNVHWVTYAWAAVLVGLLIGIAFIMINFLNRHDHNVALADNESKQQAPGLSSKDTATTLVSANNIAADSSKNIQKIAPDSVAHPPVSNTPIAQSAQTKPTNTDVKVVAGGNGSAAAYTVNSSLTASNNRAADNKVTNKSMTVYGLTDSTSTTHNGAYSNNQSAKADAAKKSAPALPPNLSTLPDEAMKHFNSGDYNTAADDFDLILKADPNNADALYFGGISDYINGQTGKSEINFDKLLKSGNKYTEGSKWYKANILLKKGRTDAAKALLQDLSNGSSSYKERAIKKLAELGF